MNLYRLEIMEEALGQLRVLPGPVRRNIGRRIDLLQTGLGGDVKKLSARRGEYRLRVGSYRILFTLERDLIRIYAVKQRQDAYE